LIFQLCQKLQSLVKKTQGIFVVNYLLYERTYNYDICFILGFIFYFLHSFYDVFI
jgi:hypothetical protein